ncbi:unnamed protein product [Cochlearia groenlandica]
MIESPHKKMKLTKTLPQDVVEHISSLYLPIQSALRNRLVSKKFTNTDIISQDLDFSGIYSMRRSQAKVVRIIENIINQHKGSKIHRFILHLNHIGVEDKVISWVKTCIGKKNIQELVLDFSKSRKVIDIPVDFSAIETLTILKLKYCNFTIPDNSPKGLRLLRTLELMQTDLTQNMIDAIFGNCIYLETLELIKCQMSGILSIKAHNQKKFKSLSVFSMAMLSQIIVFAPTIEVYKYEGFVKNTKFWRMDVLREANLLYNRNSNWRYYDSSEMVCNDISAYIGIHVLITTNIFLEALAGRYIGGERIKPNFKFMNLISFKILFKAPTTCTVFEIANFLQYCPNLESVTIDINGFTFEPGMFWRCHEKAKFSNQNYDLSKIKKVKIKGYKNHFHELEIVEFFARHAQSLEEFIMKRPANSKVKIYEPDYEKINFIKSISRKEDLFKFP